MAAAARAALTSSLSRFSSRAPAANLTSRRGLASGGDHHGPAKINIWEDPMSPSKWKEEHFVLASLSGWGLLIYGGFKAFDGKKEKEELHDYYYYYRARVPCGLGVAPLVILSEATH